MINLLLYSKIKENLPGSDTPGKATTLNCCGVLFEVPDCKKVLPQNVQKIELWKLTIAKIYFLLRYIVLTFAVNIQLRLRYLINVTLLDISDNQFQISNVKASNVLAVNSVWGCVWDSKWYLRLQIRLSPITLLP